MPTFGYTTIPSSKGVGFSDFKFGNIWPIGEGGNVTKITVYLSNVDTGHAACNGKAVIYSVSAGAPAALLGTSSETAIIDNQAAGWVDFTFSPAVTLTTGSYVLGAMFDANASGLGLFSDAGDANDYWEKTDTYADGAADPWGADTGAAEHAGVYATYATLVSGTGAVSIASPSLSGVGHYNIFGTGALQIASPSLLGVGHYDIIGTGAVSVAPPALSGTIWQNSHAHRQLTGTVTLNGIRGKVTLWGTKGKAEM